MRPISKPVSSIRLAVVALTAVTLLSLAPATVSAQAWFRGIGDLPGGDQASQIRDATRVGGTIMAVGGGNARLGGCTGPCPAFDTAILWQFDGVNTPTLAALPNLVVNDFGNSPVFASAITSDGAYIASRARSSVNLANPFPGANNQRQAVRVSTALLLLSDPAATLNLANRFSPALNPSTAAVAISQDGSILYGFGNGNAYRFDAVGGSSLGIPPPAGVASITPAARATSADGSVMVASGPDAVAGTPRGFRYVHGSGLSPIPMLAGGTWNAPAALSQDGNLILVRGDSPAFPNGEAYLYDATTGATTALGSPNRPWTPSNVAGMTADGSVVAMNFGGQSRAFAYFHNNHGWFHVAAALGAQGIDVKSQGWTELGVLGMSSDGTLLFGDGVRNDRLEGWVAEFPAGYLASFEAPAVPVANTSIVGAWHVSDVESSSPGIVVLMADGTYYIIQPTVTATEVNAAPGLERGVYTWDAGTGALRIVTLNSTMGDAGLSDNNGVLSATVFVSGDTLSFSDGGAAAGTRLVAPTGVALKDTIVGGWVVGNPATADTSFVAVFDTDGTYYLAQDGPVQGPGHPGIEQGTYAWDPTGQILTPTSIAVDTNGDWGLSDSTGLARLQPFIDGLTAQAGDDTGLMTAYRVIDPNSVIPAITSATTASGAWGSPFTFTVAATNGAYECTASGLPAGLSIDGSTGVISGAPSVSGSFDVQLTAANSLRRGSGTLRITIADKVVLSGFYAPVNSAPGYLNAAEGGSTVPLKFNISVNGVEKTDTAGIVFSLASTSCTPGGPETPHPFVTTGGTSLRYTGQMFIQNWKTPKASGCYVVRMTTAADGQSLSAAFKLRSSHDRGDHRECDHDKDREDRDRHDKDRHDKGHDKREDKREDKGKH